MYSYYYLLLLIVPVSHLLLKWSIGHRCARLQLPPGPWQLPIIGSLHHLSGDLPHRVLRDLSRRHGPLMFLKFGEIPAVVASSREAAEEVMRTNDAKLSSRPQTATVKLVTKYGPDIFLATHGDHWRQLRKICVQELLSAKRVRSFRHIREQEAMRLVQAVSAAASSPVNLDKLLAKHGGDFIVHAIVGDGPAEDREKLQHLVDKAIRLIGSFHLADLFPSSWLACALSFPAMRRAELYLDGLFKFMGEIITQHQKRKGSTQEEEDLIDVLLRIQEESSALQFPITVATIKGVLFDLLSAGGESVTFMVSWAMVELMRNPTMMYRAQSEVRKAFMGQMKVLEEGLGKLSYLHCVIKETLRLHPVAPIGVPRECEETCCVMGYDVPKGTMVLVNMWATSRDPEHWDEPDMFKPERFESDMRDFRGRDYDYTPFGSGRRMCPGMLFGLANIDLTLAHLLFYFDWSLPEGIAASEIDMTETMEGLTTRRKMDLWITPTLHVPLV